MTRFTPFTPSPQAQPNATTLFQFPPPDPAIAGPSAAAAYAFMLLTATTAVHYVFGGNGSTAADNEGDPKYKAYVVLDWGTLLSAVCVFAADTVVFQITRSPRARACLAGFRNFLWWWALACAVTAYTLLSFHDNGRKRPYGKVLTWVGAAFSGPVYGTLTLIIIVDKWNWFWGEIRKIPGWFKAGGCVRKGFTAVRNRFKKDSVETGFTDPEAAESGGGQGCCKSGCFQSGTAGGVPDPAAQGGGSQGCCNSGCFQGGAAGGGPDAAAAGCGLQGCWNTVCCQGGAAGGGPDAAAEGGGLQGCWNTVCFQGGAAGGGQNAAEAGGGLQGCWNTVCFQGGEAGGGPDPAAAGGRLHGCWNTVTGLFKKGEAGNGSNQDGGGHEV